jgi:hypothetical protein
MPAVFLNRFHNVWQRSLNFCGEFYTFQFQLLLFGLFENLFQVVCTHFRQGACQHVFDKLFT